MSGANATDNMIMTPAVGEKRRSEPESLEYLAGRSLIRQCLDAENPEMVNITLEESIKAAERFPEMLARLVNKPVEVHLLIYIERPDGPRPYFIPVDKMHKSVTENVDHESGVLHNYEIEDLYPDDEAYKADFYDFVNNIENLAVDGPVKVKDYFTLFVN